MHKEDKVIKELVKISNELDLRGLTREADIIDAIIAKANELEVIEEDQVEAEPEPQLDESSLEEAGIQFSWISRGDYETLKFDHRRDEVIPEERKTPERDLSAIQRVLDHSESNKYIVIDPWTFGHYDYQRVTAPDATDEEGRLYAIPLNTFEVEGSRINLFKINKRNRDAELFGKVVEPI